MMFARVLEMGQMSGSPPKTAVETPYLIGPCCFWRYDERSANYPFNHNDARNLEGSSTPGGEKVPFGGRPWIELQCSSLPC
jgi:hypothetical protein